MPAGVHDRGVATEEIERGREAFGEKAPPDDCASAEGRHAKEEGRAESEENEGKG